MKKNYYFELDDFKFLDVDEFYRFEDSKYSIDEEYFVEHYCTDEEIKKYFDSKFKGVKLTMEDMVEIDKCKNRLDYLKFLGDGIYDGELLDRWCHINICLYLKKNRKRIIDKKYI